MSGLYKYDWIEKLLNEESQFPAYAHKAREVLKFFLGDMYIPENYFPTEYIIRDTLKCMDDLKNNQGEPYDYGWFFEYIKMYLDLPQFPPNEAIVHQGYNRKIINENGERVPSQQE